MHRKLIAAIAALTVTAALSYQALAQTSPEDALDYRKAVMTSLRGHIGASSMIARGLVANEGQLVGHAEGDARAPAVVLEPGHPDPHLGRSPQHAAEGLRKGKTVEPRLHNNVTMFFCDVVGFTNTCKEIYPWEVIEMLNRLYCVMDHLALKFNVFKIETYVSYLL